MPARLTKSRNSMTDNTNHVAVKTGPYRTAFPYILALLVFLSSPGLVSAAGPPMLGEILAKTEANYQNIHAFTALFHQKTTSAATGTMGSAEASGKAVLCEASADALGI